MKASDTIKKIVVTLISKYYDKDETLIDAINQDVDLADLVTNKLEEKDGISVQKIRALAFFYRSKRSEITPAEVLKWLRKKSPHLVQTIEDHPFGMEWFEKNVDGILDLFF